MPGSIAADTLARTVMALLGLEFFRGPRAVLLPLYGAALGAAGAWIYHLQGLPSPAAAILISILWGGLAFAPHQRKTGVQGWIVLAATIALRFMLIENIAGPNVLAMFIAAQTVPRAGMIAIAWVSRPAGYGIAHKFSSTLTTPAALISIAIGVAAATLCGVRPAAMILVGAFLIIRVVRWFAYRYAGGVNGNLLGATQLFTELFVLAMFTCSTCRW
jgi:cobalamin synthase